jgi:hypothetical protein
LTTFPCERFVVVEFFAGNLTHSVPTFFAGLLLRLDTERYDVMLGGRLTDRPAELIEKTI